MKDPYNVTAMIRQQSVPGGSRALALLPPWMRKLVSGNKRFWQYTPEEIDSILEGRQMSRDTGNAAAELRQKERDGLRIMMGIHFTNPETPEVPTPRHDLEGGSLSGVGEHELKASSDRSKAL
jgi:AGZA family xanthine/uracil permease-like MFS transporter